MKLAAVDVRQAASAADIVYDALRKAIIEGDLAEGENLRQDQIAQMFNTSRIPVREALSRLEQHGLITTERYKGAVVAGLSIEEIDEIFEFPRLCRGRSHAACRAQPRSADAGCCARVLRRVWPGNRSARWGEINQSFHCTLYAASGRPYYLQIVRTSLDRIDRYLRAQLTLTNGVMRADREHQAILQACLEGDAALASRLTRDHVLDAGRSLAVFLKDQRA